MPIVLNKNITTVGIILWGWNWYIWWYPENAAAKITFLPSNFYNFCNFKMAIDLQVENVINNFIYKDFNWYVLFHNFPLR